MSEETPTKMSEAQDAAPRLPSVDTVAANPLRWLEYKRKLEPIITAGVEAHLKHVSTQPRVEVPWSQLMTEAEFVLAAKQMDSYTLSSASAACRLCKQQTTGNVDGWQLRGAPTVLYCVDCIDKHNEAPWSHEPHDF